MINLPGKCLRNLENCTPMSQLASDDNSSFFCCGLNKEEERAVVTDIYRLCFKNDVLDDMSDNDGRDLIDMASVILQALSVVANSKENEE